MRRIPSLVLVSCLIVGGVASALLAAQPDPAPEKVIGVLTLSGVDSEEKLLPARPDKPVKPDRPGKPPKEPEGYELMGVKWKKTPVDYVIDPDNGYGLTQTQVVEAVSASAEEWDSHTSTDLFGTYTIAHDASWDGSSPDGSNEILWGDYPQDRVIAVCVTWGYFSGPPGRREIIEFDILLDTDFSWGIVAVGGQPDFYVPELSGFTTMDVQNIVTHELGHGVGLADLYDSGLVEMTMFGYSTEGEICKRSLAWGDINGIQALYG